MPVVLSPAIHEEIFQMIKKSFADFALFESLVEKKLRNVIEDADKVEIDVKTTRKLTERYFDVQAFQTEKQKVALAQIHIILRTCYVLILSYHDNVKQLMWPNVQTLLEHYPQFADQDEQELKYLLRFRNYLRIALLIVPPRLNKQLLLKIAAHLEGSGQEYITGGGQKPCVTRRVQIYEKEGNIRAEKRLERLRPPRQPGQKRKRPSSQPSLREVKLLRLASDEIRALSKGKEANAYSSYPASMVSFPVAESDSDSISLANSFVTGRMEDNVGVEELEDLLMYNNNGSQSDLPGSAMGTAEDPSRFVMPGSSSSALLLYEPSSSANNFPPLLTREQSDLLDRLLPDGDFWKGAVDTMHPLQMMRGISWDIYNGTFTDDLRALLG